MAPNMAKPKNLVSILEHHPYGDIQPGHYRRSILERAFENFEHTETDFVVTEPTSRLLDPAPTFHRNQMTFELRKDFIIASESGSNYLPCYRIFRVRPENYLFDKRLYVQSVGFKCITAASPKRTLRCQWYPFDMGMYATIDQQRLMLHDATTMDSVLEFETPIGFSKFHHMDWNQVNFNTIALSCKTDQVFVFDVRIGASSMTIVADDGPLKAVGSHSPTRTTVVYWSPMDDHGLFIGTNSGSILFYDVRQPRRPLCRQLDHWLYGHPVDGLQMTPDNRHLISFHYFNECFVYRWRFRPWQISRDLFLQLHPHHSSSYRLNNNTLARSKKLCITGHLQPFVTNDYVAAVISVPPRNPHRLESDIIYLPFHDTKPSQRILAASEDLLPLIRPFEKGQVLYGYGDTAWNEEPCPALFFSIGRELVFRRWRNPDSVDPSQIRWWDDNPNI